VVAFGDFDSLVGYFSGWMLQPLIISAHNPKSQCAVSEERIGFTSLAGKSSPGYQRTGGETGLKDARLLVRRR